MLGVLQTLPLHFFCVCFENEVAIFNKKVKNKYCTYMNIRIFLGVHQLQSVCGGQSHPVTLHSDTK
jgi:hypothetical protein